LTEPNYSTQGKWIHGLVQGANNTVINIFHTGFNALASILNPAFRSMIPESARNDSNLRQVQDQYLLKQEELRIARTHLNHKMRSSEQIIEIERKKVELQEKELNLKQWFFRDKLEMIWNCQKETVQLKLQEFQVSWDNYRLPFLISRDETKNLLLQESYRFWILLAPPKILCDVQDFRSLDIQIEHRLDGLVSKYYRSSGISYPVGCRKIFSEPIEKIQAIHARELLAPIPTLVLHSVVTDQEVFMTVTCPSDKSSTSHNASGNQVSLPSWNWELIRDALEQQGQSSRESIRSIKELIIAFHLVLSIYFLDLYCLSLDPYHSPKLFDFLNESDVPEALNNWVAPYQNSLRQIQEGLRQQRKTIRDNSDSAYAGNFTNDWGYSPFIAIGVGIMFLFAMCSQQSPQTNGDNTGTQSFIDQRQSSQATSARIEVPTSTGYEGANLRSVPKDGNKFIIGQVKNGEQVAAYEVSPNGQWRRVKLSDGRSGWVASNFVK
jgi:hypothetical protein